MFRKLIFLTAFVTLLSACGNSEKAQEAMDKPANVKVKTQKIALTDADSSRSFTASVSSEKTALIIPKVVGYVEQVLVSPGQKVTQGQLLAVIKSGELEQKMAFASSSEMEAQNAQKQAEIGYKMAKSQFDLAEKTYARYSNLIKSNSISRQEFDQIQSQYDLARDNLSLAAEKVQQVKIKTSQAQAMKSEVNTYLSYTQLRSPFDGVVLEKNMDAGNLAAPGSPILKIGNNKPVVFAFVSQSMLSEIRVGTKANVYVDSIDESFEAEVTEISPDIDPASGNFKVKLSGCDKLTQGMFAKVRFITGKEKIIAVPDSSIVNRGQLVMVFVNRDGRAEMRVIKTGRQLGGVTEVLSGLSAGDVVVTENAHQLKSGDILEEIR